MSADQSVPATSGDAQKCIALVDDDRNILTTLSIALQAEGYATRVYSDGDTALKSLRENPPDLAVFDIKMPRMDGMELLQRLREQSDLPVIFLTSKDEEQDEEAGLAMGADDYIAKPFSQRLLLARIRAILRRSAPARSGEPGAEQGAAGAGGVIERGRLRMDAARHSVTWDGTAVPLTVTEFLILEALALRPGVIKSRNQLMDAAYPDDVFVDDRTVDSHIKRLRRKFRAVDDEFGAISTLYGAGYSFSQMAEDGGGPAARLERLASPTNTSLTSRILAVDLIPLMLLAGSLFFLDSYRRQLLDERFKLARIEAQITAEALAGATQERQDALLIQIGKEQRMRLRMYDAPGALVKDSFALAEPSFTFDDPVAEPLLEDFARYTDAAANFVVGAPQAPFYVEPAESEANAWPELVRAREVGLTQIELRLAPDRTPVINAAAPVGLAGATLLTTRNAVDITQAVRDARASLLTVIFLALIVSTVLSLYLARTIVDPLRRLVNAAVRVRLGRAREVEVPRMQERGDEIGVLARAVSDMTNALRHRIDAVEAFAADVAHEIKNPLASLRSALESLPRVEDAELRGQLTQIAAHDVRRIDRLVSEISEASRIDAELSRATFEAIDLAELVANLVSAREQRGLNLDRRIEIVRAGGSALVMGVPLRIELVLENLLDNAVSFSPPGGEIEARIESGADHVRLSVCDQGPGIPESERDKVFARFHSVRPEDEDYGNHSGLGLAISRTIAIAHDGTLSVADREDGSPGACLVLELPAA